MAKKKPTPIIEDDGLFLTVNELAEKTNVSSKFIRKAIKEMDLPVYKLGVNKILLSEFLEWAKHRPSKAS